MKDPNRPILYKQGDQWIMSLYCGTQQPRALHPLPYWIKTRKQVKKALKLRCIFGRVIWAK